MKLTPHDAWQPFEPSRDRPFDRRLAAHLFRRAGFAATRDQLDAAIKSGPQGAVHSLLAPADHQAFDDQMHTLAKTVLTGGNPESLGPWWLYRMLHTPAPLVEKMTLFWHGHFATSAAKVLDPRLMYRQNQLLRKHALGSFADLVRGIARDPAMLLYLDSASNKKTHPNENFAREVMELFCLGLGNYTERDIRELARCFTGWEIQRGEFKFNRFQYDDGPKTILGQRGSFDGDEALTILLQQPATPRFVCRKLVRFFVTDDELDDTWIEPLAEQFRASNLELAPVLETLFTSRFFYSDMALGRKVRSPVELGIGFLRALDATTSTQQLAQKLADLGQKVFFPPNVKGWDGGPTWINSATLLGRANLIQHILDENSTRFAGGRLVDAVDVLGWKTAGEVIDGWCELLVAIPLPDGVRRELVQQLERAGKQRAKGLAAALHMLGSLPEFQLA